MTFPNLTSFCTQYQSIWNVHNNIIIHHNWTQGAKKCIYQPNHTISVYYSCTVAILPSCITEGPTFKVCIDSSAATVQCPGHAQKGEARHSNEWGNINRGFTILELGQVFHHLSTDFHLTVLTRSCQKLVVLFPDEGVTHVTLTLTKYDLAPMPQTQPVHYQAI